MKKEDSTSRLHHDLRDALSVVRLNLQTLETLESGKASVSPEKRLSILRRAREALEAAVDLVGRLRA